MTAIARAIVFVAGLAAVLFAITQEWGTAAVVWIGIFTLVGTQLVGDDL